MRVGATITLRPFAKINLTLAVGPRRADGFHDVRTLMQAISLADRLVLTRRRGPLALAVTGAAIAADRSNLVYRAAASLWRAMGRDGEPTGVDVRLDKRIPAAAGLGGGSADAAAALVGLNALWRARLPAAELGKLAAALGSDVPFFLGGGAALGVGHGDELYPVQDLPRFDVVILAPAFGVATADAYRWFDEDGAKAPATGGRIEVGWATGPLEVANSLQPAVAARHPEIGRMIRGLERAGALAAAMTGSGSAVFGLYEPGRGAGAAARLAGRGWQVHRARTMGRRESARRLGSV